MDNSKQIISELLEKVITNTENFLGYPVSKDFDYDELMPFLKYPMNNLGDPFINSTYGVNSNEMEKEVIAFFAKLFRAEPNNWWGYVSNGGSEGNLYGLYLARERYPKAMVYYSESTHYSVQKNLHLLNMPCIVIRTQDNGEMDYDDLKESMRNHRNVPAIVLANIGTTMTEAVDDVQQIKRVMKSLAIQHHYVHCDAALGGIINALTEPRPAFDFKDGADSIAISGHKFIGSPIPCGVVVVKKTNRDRIAMAVSYIGSSDTTITGSRNGHSPLFLWYALRKLGIEGLKARVAKSRGTAEYALTQFRANNIPAWRNPNAITVVIPPQPKVVAAKWQLATEGDLSHVICMPNVTHAQIDDLIQDILNSTEDEPLGSEMYELY
ncbi:histidine decarboxylase [Owenweeksia hongkongensis]|uniref:histidine decarboxylase n=1 Tax=Owenweeksia hongkongensis TaxID=253245 RepID=UPI003A8F06B4